MKKYLFLFFTFLFCKTLQGQTSIDTFLVSGIYKLRATITLPDLQSSKKFPAVILLAGSGLADKDGAYKMPNKTMKDLAEGLSREGLACIRFEKRTLAYREEIMKNYEKITIEQEYHEDTKNAIDLISGLKQVDKNNIWIVGHSLGATLAPSIAFQNIQNVKGIVMMAGTMRKFEDLIMEQYEYIYSLDTTQKALKNEMIAMKQKVKNVKMITTESSFSTQELPLYLPQSYWLSLAKNAPDLFLAKMNKPILVLQGERDYKVTMQDFLEMKSFLGNKAHFVSYPTLNHIFLEGKLKKSVPLEEFVPSQIPNYVFKDIADFIFSMKK